MEIVLGHPLGTLSAIDMTHLAILTTQYSVLTTEVLNREAKMKKIKLKMSSHHLPATIKLLSLLHPFSSAFMMNNSWRWVIYNLSSTPTVPTRNLMPILIWSWSTADQLPNIWATMFHVCNKHKINMVHSVHATYFY